MERDGDNEDKLGTPLGKALGTTLGTKLGEAVGDGAELGFSVGSSVVEVGCVVGMTDRPPIGATLGDSLGKLLFISRVGSAVAVV